jgi:leucyl-tRNA synthetase
MNNPVESWPEYRPQEIEPKWQALWEQSGLYLADDTSQRPKYYCLDFFPYPSGDGLHVGHCRNYIPTDVMSRYKRMRGFNVLHPMGWDAFGEPSEQYAIRHNVHPRQVTDQNTANFRRQLTLLGTSYDWSREIDSSRPKYYRWTQWFFLKMYKRGLAYRDHSWQWWCPVCQTTLSSHEVTDGVCWRGHSGVTRKKIPAWYFRITAYADELLSGLDEIDWPEAIKSMQRNWIGRSEGCEVIFHTPDGVPIPVFTTRPDTLYGVTFFVLAPEHELVKQLTISTQQAAVQAYLNATARRSEVERMQEEREKTGVFTGAFVVNPLSQERVPVWVADYVLPGYGTGAVMGVPAHDRRDFEFAQKYGLPIRTVIQPIEQNPEQPAEAAFTSPGRMVDSGPFSGMTSMAGMQAVAQELTRRSAGGWKVQYRMRDWLISRQRYWGTPIPIVYCAQCGEVPIPENELPVLLPDMDDFRPDGTGRSPLARSEAFLNTTCPQCGGAAERETDTMGGFACSSWYFLRFTSPHEMDGPFDAETMRYWMPVDLYVGGAEHAVLHLLYARFWTKVLADEGLVPFREPFARLRNQGQLMGPDGMRMSKSRGNVITPDAIAATFGADALRVYEMFMAPFDQDVDWTQAGIQGAGRFLNRVWSLYQSTYYSSHTTTQPDPDLERALHRTIQQVTERIADFRLNTMIAALMEFANLLGEYWRTDRWQTSTYHDALNVFLILLAPAAPHISEELWHLTGHPGSVHQQTWPEASADLLVADDVEVPVQINGRLRATIRLPLHASSALAEARALADPKVQQFLQHGHIERVYYVPDKIINLIVN